MASILVVCTGNVCRSPMAVGFLGRGLERRFGSDAPSVGSAGTIGWEGVPAIEEAVFAAVERDCDIRGHLSHALKPDLISEASLVLGMAGEHRDAIVRMVPEADSRTFTLKELVRLLKALPAPAPDVRALDDRLRERVEQAESSRRAGSVGNLNDEDIVDPMAAGPETFRAVAWEIDTLCGELIDGLFGEARAGEEAEGNQA